MGTGGCGARGTRGCSPPLPVSHPERHRQLVIHGLMLLVCLEACLILLCLVSCCVWLVQALRGASRRRAAGGSSLPTGGGGGCGADVVLSASGCSPWTQKREKRCRIGEFWGKTRAPCIRSLWLPDEAVAQRS